MQVTVLGIGSIAVNSINSPCPLGALAVSSDLIFFFYNLFLAPVTACVSDDVKIEFKFARRSRWTNNAEKTPHKNSL